MNTFMNKENNKMLDMLGRVVYLGRIGGREKNMIKRYCLVFKC